MKLPLFKSKKCCVLKSAVNMVLKVVDKDVKAPFWKRGDTGIKRLGRQDNAIPTSFLYL